MFELFVESHVKSRAKLLSYKFKRFIELTPVLNLPSQKETDLIFAKFDATDDFTLINHMLLLGKFYLYSSRCQKISEPNLSGFIARTKRVYYIELYIARENDKLLQHLNKWEISILLHDDPRSYLHSYRFSASELCVLTSNLFRITVYF